MRPASPSYRMIAIAFALMEETPTFTSDSRGEGGGQQGEIRNTARQRQNGENGRVHEDKKRLSKWRTIERGGMEGGEQTIKKLILSLSPSSPLFVDTFSTSFRIQFRSNFGTTSFSTLLCGFSLPSSTLFSALP